MTTSNILSTKNNTFALLWIIATLIFQCNLLSLNDLRSPSDTINVEGITIREEQLYTNARNMVFQVGEKKDHIFLMFYDYKPNNGHKTNYKTFFSKDFGDTFHQIELSNGHHAVDIDYIKVLHGDICAAGSFRDKILLVSSNSSSPLTFSWFPFDSTIGEIVNCKEDSNAFAVYALNADNVSKVVVSFDRFKGNVVYQPFVVEYMKCVNFQKTLKDNIEQQHSFLIYTHNSTTKILYNINSKYELVPIFEYEDYQVFDDGNHFLSIKHKNSGGGYLKLKYSENGIAYDDCIFPKRLKAKNFYVTHVDKYGEIYVLVKTDNMTSLYAGNKKDMKFVKILEDLIEDIHSSCSAVSINYGIPGTILATLKHPTNHNSNQLYQNVISYNGGTDWVAVVLLEEELHSIYPNCKTMDCAVRLELDCKNHATNDWIHAPWIISVWGEIVDKNGNMVNDKLNGYRYEGTFFSHNGGHSWATFFRNKVQISVLNHGAIMVSNTLHTKEISISMDEGHSWKSVPFSVEPRRVFKKFVLENDEEMKFLMMSHIAGNPNISITKFYFLHLLNRTCTPEDFEDYVFHVTSELSCYRGELRVFKRKHLNSKCRIDTSQLIKVYDHKCTCSLDDFICDFGYMKNKDGLCVPDPDDDYHSLECTLENKGKLMPSGYKDLDFDNCKHDYTTNPEKITHSNVCYFAGDTSFLALITKNYMNVYIESSRNKFKPTDSFTLKFDKNISHLQFDFRASCLYGVSNYRLMRYCWGHANQFVTTKFSTVPSITNEIAAIQFDYTTRNLYTLTISGALIIYQIDKDMKKTIQQIGRKITNFKLNPLMGVILYRVENNKTIFAMNSDGSTIKDFKEITDQADIFEFDLHQNFIITISAHNEHPKIYDIKGKLVNIEIHWKIRDAITKAATGDGYLFYTTEEQLIISDHAGNDTELSKLNDDTVALIYHPKEIGFVHFCYMSNCEHFCFNHGKEGSCGCEDNYHPQKDSTTSNLQKCVKNNDTCKKDEFSCVSISKCIPLSKKCDEVDDCGDYSDETDCNYDCASDEFHCEIDHKCIPESKRCNRVNDCSDGSDETGCFDDSNCNDKTKFNCLNGKCIDLNLKCNGVDECGNGLDEFNCQHHCKDDQFHCGSGECISRLLRCNGRNDCADMSDEENCSGVSCADYCGDVCLQSSDFCNGIKDCENGYDEKNCGRKGSVGKKVAIAIIAVLISVAVLVYVFRKFDVYSKVVKAVRLRSSYQRISTFNRFYDRNENSGLLSNTDSYNSEDEDFFY